MNIRVHSFINRRSNTLCRIGRKWCIPWVPIGRGPHRSWEPPWRVPSRTFRMHLDNSHKPSCSPFSLVLTPLHLFLEIPLTQSYLSSLSTTPTMFYTSPTTLLNIILQYGHGWSPNRSSDLKKYRPPGWCTRKRGLSTETLVPPIADHTVYSAPHTKHKFCLELDCA